MNDTGSSASSNPSWADLGVVSVADLSDARLQLHWAVQIVASFGNSLIQRRADDSQSNLGWRENLGALCGHVSSEGLSVGLRLVDLTLLFLDSKGKVISECGLPGHTLHQGFDWLTSTYSEAAGVKPAQAFALRDYAMPVHPIGKGAAFSLHPSAPFQAYHHWYADAHHVLQALSKNWRQASPVRCWPHHFDIATLVILDPDKRAQEARSVGCGMSPGDSTYPEPYWYVTPWPYPDKEKLSALTVGHWHTDGWIGAILTASDLVKDGSLETQAQRVYKFFQDGTQAVLTTLGVHPS